MSDFKNAVLGILLAIFGLLLTIVGWFWIPQIASVIELDYLKVIFYVGFIGTWISAIIVTPATMIMGGAGNIKDVVKGVGTFFIGTFSGILAYWVILPMNEVLQGIFSSSTINAICWIALTFYWIITMVLLPLYLCLRSSLKLGGKE